MGQHDYKDPHYTTVDFATMAQGAGNLLINEGLKAIAENIDDINTPAKKSRVLTLKIEITPVDEKRRQATVKISCERKLAQLNGVLTQIFFGKVDDENIISEFDPRQLTIFDATGDKGAS